MHITKRNPQFLLRLSNRFLATTLSILPNVTAHINDNDKKKQNPYPQSSTARSASISHSHGVLPHSPQFPLLPPSLNFTTTSAQSSAVSSHTQLSKLLSPDRDSSANLSPKSPKKFAPPALNLSQKPQKSASISAQDRDSSANLSPELASVICPSFAYANTLFCQKVFHVQVRPDEREHEERLIGRFRRDVLRAGVIQEVKRRKFHEGTQEKKKRKTRDAARRNSRSRRNQSRPFFNRNDQEVSSEKRDGDEDEEEDDGDNWELPGDIPD